MCSFCPLIVYAPFHIHCELFLLLRFYLINIPLSLSLAYHSRVYSVHDPNRYVCLRRCQKTRSQLPHQMPHS